MDKYTVYARIYPGIIVSFPLVVLGIAYSIELDSFYHATASLGLTAVLTYFFSNLIRELGKKQEARLWRDWGGLPSSQLFHPGNDHFDKITKANHHRKMGQLVASDKPSSEISDNLVLFDAWSKYLVSHTRDRRKYPLVYRENIEYGFRRNLWAVKPIGLVLLFLVLVANYIYHAATKGIEHFLQYPVQFYFSETTLLVFLLLWILAVSRSWIRTQAFTYAERLLETIDQVFLEEVAK